MYTQPPRIGHPAASFLRENAVSPEVMVAAPTWTAVSPGTNSQRSTSLLGAVKKARSKLRFHFSVLAMARAVTVAMVGTGVVVGGVQSSQDTRPWDSRRHELCCLGFKDLSPD